MWRGWIRAPTGRERKTCGPSSKSAGWSVAGQYRRAARARLRPRTNGKFKGNGANSEWRIANREGRKDRSFSPIRYSRLSIRISLRRRVGETVALELVAQRGFQDLAGRGVRKAVDEDDVIRHPPFRDLAVHELQYVLARRVLALLELDDQERPFVPFGMINADHRGFRYRGMTDGEGFQIDRREPFAAGLDDVLGTVGDPHVAMRVDGRDVTGVEIALVVQDIGIDAEIGLGDGGPGDLEPAEGLAVPRQLLARIVGDLHLHAVGRVALGLQHIQQFLAGALRAPRLQTRQRCEH